MMGMPARGGPTPAGPPRGAREDAIPPAASPPRARLRPAPRLRPGAPGGRGSSSMYGGRGHRAPEPISLLLHHERQEVRHETRHDPPLVVQEDRRDLPDGLASESDWSGVYAATASRWAASPTPTPRKRPGSRRRGRHHNRSWGRLIHRSGREPVGDTPAWNGGSAARRGSVLRAGAGNNRLVPSSDGGQPADPSGCRLPSLCAPPARSHAHVRPDREPVDIQSHVNVTSPSHSSP